MGEVELQMSETARAALIRIEQVAGRVPEISWFAQFPNPEEIVLRFEQWLLATTAPGFYVDSLAENATARRKLLMVLAASHTISDMLIKNPDLGSIFFDSEELAHFQGRDEIVAAGAKLLESCSSYSHRLDRLRYLQQRVILPIVVNDLCGTWRPPRVWKALSELADALICLTRDVVWAEFKRQDPGRGRCPVSVIGFGKLGGQELNFSSDIDLVFVTDEEPSSELSRFCEMFVRAMTDKMGRGQLYRVDLRLRPYGGAGAIVGSIRSYENYYRLYAEPWEIQALIRSRMLCGSEEVQARWNSIRRERCFPATVPTEWIDSVLEMRARTEDWAADEDIKRGSGGIRDVEFFSQVMQMVHGHGSPELQVANTLDVIAVLQQLRLIDDFTGSNLRNGYTFLRQLEHRIQFEGGAQTHSVPTSEAAQLRLAHLMELETAQQLLDNLSRHRRTIENLYRSALHPQEEQTNERAFLASELGEAGKPVLHWFDVLPGSPEFYKLLASNRDSISRVRKIALFAPKLLTHLQSSLELTELVVSGEVEEPFDPSESLQSLPFDASPKRVATMFTAAWVRHCASWVFAPDFPLSRSLSELSSTLIRHVASRLGATFDIVGLGSLALGNMSPDSDADLLFLVSKADLHQDAEMNAQFFVSFFEQLKRLGAPVAVDLRLRPQGRVGLLARTYEGFAKYELEDMEMWERIALGQSIHVRGDAAARQLVRKAAYAQPLTPERLKELLEMKRRIETERVSPQHLWRDVKIGAGGIADIEWLVHILEMRYPTATKAHLSEDFPSRIRTLAAAQLIHLIERDTLLEAYRYLVTLRTWLNLQNLGSLVPENPDKLDRLASSMGFENGNAFLAHHTRTVEAVRAIYLEGMERLRA